jgi:hypothetical protein
VADELDGWAACEGIGGIGVGSRGRGWLGREDAIAVTSREGIPMRWGTTTWWRRRGLAEEGTQGIGRGENCGG